MNTSAYLQRINYQGSLAPTAETLRQLHVAHLLTVPFENLSIHSGEPIVLTDEALFDKIVRRRRGGFCYELNGLFGALLRALGFDVVMLSARVRNEQGEYGPEFDHLALLVKLAERWLVDVGFGDSFREPLLLDSRSEQTQGKMGYRIDSEDDQLIMMQRDGDSSWQAQYRFRLEAHQYADYADMCVYHQTSPESHFTQLRICSRATPAGRVTLSGKRLIRTEVDRRHEQEVKDERQFAAALREEFGIVMGSSATDAPPV